MVLGIFQVQDCLRLVVTMNPFLTKYLHTHNIQEIAQNPKTLSVVPTPVASTSPGSLLGMYMPCVTKWMNIEGIMLSEIRQTEKDRYSMLSIICGI